MTIIQSITARLRTFFAAKIPPLLLPQNMKTEELNAATRRGLLHRLLIAIDGAAGVFGAWVPGTISARTAVRLRACQWIETDGAGAIKAVTWHPDTPTWALALGAFLESVDHGHLVGALRADTARSVLTLLSVTGGSGLSIHHRNVTEPLESDADPAPAAAAAPAAPVAPIAPPSAPAP